MVAPMQETILQQIERRALDVRVGMAELCQATNTAISTISRWRAGAKPRMKTVRKLERHLADLEAAKPDIGAAA